MNKKKAIVVGISVVIGTVLALFGIFVLVLWMLDEADRYSRGG